MRQLRGSLAVLGTCTLLAALALGANPAAAQQPQPPGKEVPIKVAGPVRLAYRFQQSQFNQYFWRSAFRGGGQTIPLLTTIGQQVVRVLPAPGTNELPKAEVQYTISMSATSAEQGQAYSSAPVSLSANQAPDGRLSQVRTAEGEPIENSPSFFVLAGIFPEYFLSFALPQKEIAAGGSWTASVMSLSSFSFHTAGTGRSATSTATSVKRAPWRYKYVLLGFVNWDGHNCAKIKCVVVSPPQKHQLPLTFYFDYENGVLVGQKVVYPKGPSDVMWLAPQ